VNRNICSLKQTHEAERNEQRIEESRTGKSVTRHSKKEEEKRSLMNEENKLFADDISIFYDEARV
jgi:hypothetical protein